MTDAIISYQEISEACRKIADFKESNFYSENMASRPFGKEKNFEKEKYTINNIILISERLSFTSQGAFLALTEKKLKELSNVAQRLLSTLQSMRKLHEEPAPSITSSDPPTRATEETLKKQELQKYHDTLSKGLSDDYEGFIKLAQMIIVGTLPAEIQTVSRRIDSLQTQDVISKYSKIFEHYSCAHACSSNQWLYLGFAMFIGTFSFSHFHVYPEIRMLIEKSMAWQNVLGLITLNAFALGLLTTLTFWAFRNYSINKHNELTNKLKSAALRSFKNFTEATVQNKDIQHIVVKKIADTVFDLNRFGYLKNETDEAITPTQVVDALLQIKNEK
jgi:hypothetical protein